MDKEQKANFTGIITELRKHVFEIMDVIITTASNAGDAKLYAWVQPSMIFVDEAARVPEPDSWSLFAFYAVDTPKILVGDMAQLKPPAHYENRFRQQFSLSLMGRFAMIGYPLVMLNEQHKMHSSICKVVSTTFYDGKIRTAPIHSVRRSANTCKNISSCREIRLSSIAPKVSLSATPTAACSTTRMSDWLATWSAASWSAVLNHHRSPF